MEKINFVEHDGASDFEKAMQDVPEFNNFDDTDSKKTLDNFLDDLKNDPTNFKIGDSYCTKSSLVSGYAFNHEFTEDVKRGFLENIFPRMEQHDSETEPLEHTTNSWGMDKYGYGIADYIVSCFTKYVTPKNIQNLMYAYREVPTSDYNKFEENRRDAIALQNVLYPGRDFIHDERPGIHELLQSMLDFYDTKDDEEKHKKAEDELRRITEARLNSKDGGYYGKYSEPGRCITDFCFNLNNYEINITRDIHAGNDRNGKVHYDEPAVDILRRMVKNTEQVSLEKPEIDDDEMNEILKSYTPRLNKETGEVFVDWRDTGKLVKRANEILISKQGELGIEPSKIKMLSYVEKMATYAMRGISKKDWAELPFDSDFKEMVRFSELTASSSRYNNGKFEDFYQHFLSQFGKNWPEDISEKYTVLGQHVIREVFQLARDYKEDNAPKEVIDALWSGNLTHELIGLSDER